MPIFHMQDSEAPAYNALDTFTRSYIEAIFWTDNGPGTTTEEWQREGFEPREGSIPADVGFLDFDPDTLADIVKECAQFQTENAARLNQAYEENGYTESQAGIDFWLTRNHHGAGFWDRDALDWFSAEDNSAKLGDLLTDAAHAYGESDSYLGDDGKVYLT
jgi:hypothetical protein